MNILILGGTGVLGQEIIPLLAADNKKQIFVTSRRKIDSTERIKYIQGNAKDKSFVIDLFNKFKFDVIIDFMLYSIEEFKERYELLLMNCKQYIYLSSSRVYAASENPLTESSPRLLDVSKDEKFLKSNEYSLIKAAEEDILRSSRYKNWVIIRPYKTYGINRLQLGVLEMEQWLERAKKGKKVVALGDIENLYTSLTDSRDTAKILCRIIGDYSLNREIFQIANPELIKWKDIVAIYSEIIMNRFGKEMKIIYKTEISDSALFFNNKYRIKYDGLLNRKFDDCKIKLLMGEDFEWTPLKIGLTEEMERTLDQTKSEVLNYSQEGHFDRIANEYINLFKINGNKNRIKYILHRCINEKALMSVKKILKRR